jgi:hypothetical protein
VGKGTRARAGRETTEECKGAKRSGAPVERGMTIRVQSSEYRVRSTEGGKIAVQKCKTAYGLCEGGKVDDKNR